MTSNGNGVERRERDDDTLPPAPIYNWLSVNGAALAAIGLTIAVFLVVIESFTREATGYGGLTLLPPLFLAAIGCAMIVGGWIREKRRQRRGIHSRFVYTWIVDPLSIVRSKGPLVLLLGTSVVTIALMTTGAGSVAVVEFSESNQFCSDVCHVVMSPEATAYKTTAHSRIDCVACHVGAGAEGFLEAKIGGLRQLWGVAAGTFRRPIPTPIHGDNISRELCEKCHSPSREIGYKALTRQYILSGLEDSVIELAMVVKVGGNKDGMIPGGGIHYHMLNAQKVEYIARDPQRQEIAWIRVTEEDGSVREFTHKSEPLSENEKSSLAIREMECIDCHSRPAHAFQAPVDVITDAIHSGRLPNDIFYLKEASVRAIDGGYDSVDEAMTGIETSLLAYYEEQDPDVLEERPEEITAIVEELRRLYRATIFPDMKTDWLTHPNNLGHRDWPGCFRCHNDEMVDTEGSAVFTDCSRCHSILAQDSKGIETASALDKGMGFAHPQDGKYMEDFKLCSKCHTGGKELYD